MKFDFRAATHNFTFSCESVKSFVSQTTQNRNMRYTTKPFIDTKRSPLSAVRPSLRIMRWAGNLPQTAFCCDTGSIQCANAQDVQSSQFPIQRSTPVSAV